MAVKLWPDSRSTMSVAVFRNVFRRLFHTVVASYRSPMTSLATSQCSPSAVQLHVKPSSALVDDDIQVRVTGLQPYQPVTVTAKLQETACFLSHGHYTATAAGEIDLNSQASDGGTYTGVEPMGLLWSMSPARGERPGTRLVKKDVTKPLTVDLSVLSDTVAVKTSEDIEQARTLAQGRIDRWYMGPGVQRVGVRDGKIRGTLFLPTGKGPFPGVIDMFGTAGGLNEYRASLLASRGIAALALAFFDYEDLPSSLNLELEYFDEAVEWLSRHPKILESGIGTVGVSKGAELALHMAIHNAKVVATVAINSYYFYSSAIQTYKGKECPTIFPSMSLVEVTEEGMNCRRAYWEGHEEATDCFIPVERLESPVLLIHGTDDQMCTPEHGERIAQRMREHGRTNYRLIVYPGAGHLIEPPHSPLCDVTYHKLIGSAIINGGDTRLHSRAQEASWREIIAFLKTNIQSSPEQQDTSKL